MRPALAARSLIVAYRAPERRIPRPPPLPTWHVSAQDFASELRLHYLLRKYVPVL